MSKGDLKPVPRRIDVKVGFACNNRCRFCVQGNKREKYGNRSKGDLEDILRNSSEKFTGIVFTGGEPTLHSDIISLTRTAKDLGFRSIQIQTNGRMLAYKSFCNETIEAGATEISPAIHGHRAQLHDYLTTVEGSFEQSVQGIRNTRRTGLKIVTNSVITRSNYRHLPEIARLLLSLEVDQIQFAFVHPVGSAGSDRNFASVVPRFELIAPYIHSALEIGIRGGVPTMTEAVPYCFMKDYEDCVGERIMPGTKIFDAEVVVEDYGQYRLEEGKTKGEKCRECKWFSSCEGPWKEYVERFGWGEFEPVR